MKKSIQSLFAVAAFGLATLVAQAQPAPKILVIDLAKIYDGHYSTEEQNAKFSADKEQAQAEVDRLNKEGNALVAQFTELNEQSNNPAATPEAKAKAQNEAKKKYDQIQAKQNEVQSFMQSTQRTLNLRMQNFRGVLIEQISKIATDIAKRKGATILLDKSGPTVIGVSNLVYVDPSYEITDEVIAEINKSRPATAPAAAPAAGTPATQEPAPSDAPKITVPGLTPKK